MRDQKQKKLLWQHELEVIQCILDSKEQYRKIIKAAIARWVKDFQDNRIEINTDDDLRKLPFGRFHDRLREKAGDARARAVTYVAMGDSVTQGCMQADVSEYENIYHQVLKRGIEQHYPGMVLNVINSGVGGDTSQESRSRWERDVLIYKPDLVTLYCLPTGCLSR